MIHWRRGEVSALTGGWGEVITCEVALEDGSSVPALAYRPEVGSPEVGDTVVLNVSALLKSLGTGGHALVVALPDRLPPDPADETGAQPAGHIVKARYTPLQTMVLALEEQESAAHDALRTRAEVVAGDLDGMPVVVAELHSALPAVVAGLHLERPGARVVYVMTDTGALPLAFSRRVAQMRARGMLASTVTVGQAYGGEHEAITLHSGLLAARYVLGADVVVVAQGPGNAGSATTWGYSGISQGESLNAVHTLGGRGIAALRVSGADPRERHRGLSHHAGTALGRVVLGAADLPFADDEALSPGLRAAVEDLCARAAGDLRPVSVLATGLEEALRACPVPLRTMGRGLDDDPAAFLTTAAAGRYAARLLQ